MEKMTTLGLKHIALFVKNLEACVTFYVDILNMQIVWQPDHDNVYLSSGHDNLALHRAPLDHDFSTGNQRLDHIGFAIKSPEEVDHWHDFLVSKNIRIHAKPKTHRDGARSFYCSDPDGNVIQMIYHPSMCL